MTLKRVILPLLRETLHAFFFEAASADPSCTEKPEPDSCNSGTALPHAHPKALRTAPKPFRTHDKGF